MMNNQRARVLVVFAMILPMVGGVATSPVRAEERPAEAVRSPAAGATHAQQMTRAYQEQLRYGGLMIGHVSLARMALEHGVLDAAGRNVDEALRLARILEKRAPEFTSRDSVSFGKLTHEEERTVRVFYIPIMDETFIVHDLDVRAGKSDKIRETDAQMVHAHVSLDIRKAIGGLTDARAALAKNDPVAAEAALNGVLSAAVTEETVVSDPLHAAHDNLVLAENLLREKQYDAARFALKYARTGFEDYGARVHEPARKQHAEQMRKDIDELSERLRKEDPSALQKAAGTVKGWAVKVKDWLRHPYPEPGPKPEPHGR